eukprot:gene21751-31679_t
MRSHAAPDPAAATYTASAHPATRGPISAAPPPA